MTNPVTNPYRRPKSCAMAVSRVFHRGSVAVCDVQGVVRLARGDVESPIFPRSALKPIQALALLETGAAKSVRRQRRGNSLSPAPPTTAKRPTSDAVTRWLSRLDLSEDALACGAHWSLTESVGAGHGPSRRSAL